MVQHLDLDERNRTLSLFAYPSYCAVICLSDPQSTAPLSELVNDLADVDAVSDEQDAGSDEEHTVSDEEDAVSGGEAHKGNQQPFDDLCREILVSFGIIFAQESASRRTVRSHAKKEWLEARHKDDILWDLCSKRWQENLLFEYLRAPPTRSNYSARADFPLLGEKLVRLQDYMTVQSPNDFKTLMFDHRDPLKFWTFVIALSFGDLSLLVSLAALVVATAQLAIGD
ncbi:hypothetical protein CORC01_07105 [Colletotrichum orchidophilum]|uniref:Uncharacterized protein n=1 Tax=Colletotrichum orchidophilum TaxID=1209926 RepID=A0A1G4B8A5_9PEZI|nr:uncharacterized protein CORC01_07105 [Colletotrichum orchidophilum]OHE97690.1 hypothetical protein CORC01_07105 [Colletotrichum orchidophilum]